VRALLAQTPQAGRIQTADDHAPLGHQHALDFAQRGVRVQAELERVRQNHQVQAVGGKGQGYGMGQQRYLPDRRSRVGAG